MTTKNPFEVRSDILALAKSYMDRQMELNLEFSKKLMEANKITVEQAKEMFESSYSTKAWLDLADTLNKFVSKQ